MKNYIDFNFFGNNQTINDSPNMEQSKSWMKFNTDATKSSMYAPKNKDLRITMKINPNSHTDIYSQSDLDIQNRRYQIHVRCREITLREPDGKRTNSQT